MARSQTWQTCVGIISKAVNHITSEQECLHHHAWKRAKVFVGVTMAFTKVAFKLFTMAFTNFQNYHENKILLRKNLDNTTNSIYWMLS